MKNGILLIALLMAATAFTIGVPHAAQPNSATSAQTETTSSPTTMMAIAVNRTTPHHTTTTVPLNTTTPHHKTTTVPLNTTTPDHKTTTVHLNTTTPHHKTTTVPLNTTTPHHKTTTVPLNTTTPHHNTTAVPLNTTTPHPNTTTPHTTTPLPGPTSPTNITGGNYTVLDKNNKTCVMADFEIKIFVNNSEVNGTFIVQPIKTNTSGYCEDKVASLFLQFDEGEITMKFRNNETSKMVYVETLEYELNYAFKSGALRKYSGKNESLQLFAAAAGHSYSCKDVKVFVGQGVHLDFTKSRVQAYNIKNKNFGKTDLCKADQPDYRVPIAVAIILILLIVIVVIAYCISRKRRTNGYQSL
ncbi:macrosialin [Triplophysa rosa]|uniref:Macrosialin n=1 Tax=Triplophysa rosa TaxID=992332 RepID=A0A9W7W945_TRIRA|nr:macrosialin [Triplophysa rosa]KAI7790710.1 putative macrosialin [Triplophysa rosa]